MTHTIPVTSSDNGVETWKEHTTTFDRVRSVAQALDQTRSASYIAEEAAVSETTANNHLDRLVEMDTLRTVPTEDTTLYEPDPLYVRFRTLRRLIDDHDHEELVQLKADLQQEIDEFETQFNADSPTNLREQAADTKTTDEAMRLIENASDWELALYHFSVVNNAIDNYSEYAHTDSRI